MSLSKRSVKTKKKMKLARREKKAMAAVNAAIIREVRADPALSPGSGK